MHIKVKSFLEKVHETSEKLFPVSFFHSQMPQAFFIFPFFLSLSLSMLALSGAKTCLATHFKHPYPLRDVDSSPCIYAFGEEREERREKRGARRGEERRGRERERLAFLKGEVSSPKVSCISRWADSSSKEFFKQQLFPLHIIFFLRPTSSLSFSLFFFSLPSAVS